MMSRAALLLVVVIVSGCSGGPSDFDVLQDQVEDLTAELAALEAKWHEYAALDAEQDAYLAEAQREVQMAIEALRAYLARQREE